MLKLVKTPTSELSCTLLPGKYTGAEPVPVLYNIVYEYWKKTWSEFFKKAGSPADALNIENYMRHSFIITLHNENQIAGTLLASLFNLSALTTYDHPCIKPFPKNLLDQLKAKSAGLCITGEYLSVHPKYRKENLGISLAGVLVGLKMKIFVDRQIEMALAATVRAAKVDEIARNYGYTEVGSYLKIGVDCVMLYNTQESVREHPDAAVAAIVNRCWNERRDHTGITKDSENTRKSA